MKFSIILVFCEVHESAILGTYEDIFLPKLKYDLKNVDLDN